MRTTRGIGFLTLLGLLGAAVGVLAGPDAAGAVPACSIVEQLTATIGANNGTGRPSVDADGSRIAFESGANLTGNNADGNKEIFVVDRDTDTIVQLTNTASPVQNDHPSISDDGTLVAFDSKGDLTTGNADLSREIYLATVAGPTLTRLTGDPVEDSSFPDISGDGTDVAFESSGNLTGTNADAGSEIFIVNTAGTPTPHQLTFTGAGASSEEPAVNHTGSRVAFGSSANHVPPNNADGSSEIFLVDVSGPTVSQLTSSTATSRHAALSADGSRIVFDSFADLTGANPDGNGEVFSRSVLGSTVQLTNTTGGSNNATEVAASGTRMVFQTNSTGFPGNADGSTEVVMADSTGSSGASLVTNFAGPSAGAFDPSVSADGSFVAFRMTRNPLGTNADLNTELFLAQCGAAAPSFSDVPTSNVFFGPIEWMSALGVASGFPGGLFKPQDSVNRQQMANFLYNLAGQPAFTPPATPTFSDYPASSTFYLQVEWMAAEEIAAGFPDGTFRPRDPVKRQQMANFLYNLAGQPVFTPPGSPTFTDVPNSNVFFGQIEWMADEDIASGFPDGTFKPQDAVKRQQMANFLHNLAVTVGVHV